MATYIHRVIAWLKTLLWSSSPSLDAFLYAEGGWLLEYLDRPTLPDLVEELLEEITRTGTPYRGLTQITECTKILVGNVREVRVVNLRRKRWR